MAVIALIDFNKKNYHFYKTLALNNRQKSTRNVESELSVRIQNANVIDLR